MQAPIRRRIGVSLSILSQLSTLSQRSSSLPSSFDCLRSDLIKVHSRQLHAVVPNRRILSVKGRDTIKLIQNLTTNDVNKLQDTQFTAFLTPQGRTIGMAFLFRPDEETLWIDVDAGASGAVLESIKRFKLRSKVTLSDMSESLVVMAHWDDDVPPSDALGSGQDKRTPLMGFRSIVNASSEAVKAARDNGKAYAIHRSINGVADTAAETAGGLPLEANLDLMGGVDFRKGCYIGQELTARTHHTGIIRKRILPISLFEDLSRPPTQLEHTFEAHSFAATFDIGTDVRSEPVQTQQDSSKPSRGRSAGKILSNVDNVGLAMLRLEQVHRTNKVELRMSVQASLDGDKAEQGNGTSASTYHVRPWIPSWWPTDVVSA